MTLTDRRLRFLRRLALLCVVMVLAVTSLSAYLRLSKAGLGCADWPACYGQALRHQQQGLAVPAEEQTATAAARLAHRITASMALLLVITMLMVCFGSQPVLLREGMLALALLGLALSLAVLGVWSSAARLPAVAMGNLLGGFMMLGLSVRLVFAGRPLHQPGLRPWVGVAIVLVLLQVALGVLVSASYAGLSCTSLSSCSLGEALRSADWGQLNPWREPVLDATPPVQPSGVLAHSLHRHMALLVALWVIPLGIAALRRGRRATGAVLLALLIAQLAVGLAMTVLALPLAPALAHNLLAAALLATLLTLF